MCPESTPPTSGYAFEKDKNEVYETLGQEHIICIWPPASSSVGRKLLLVVALQNITLGNNERDCNSFSQCVKEMAEVTNEYAFSAE